jgi:hypothetical protein
MSTVYGISSHGGSATGAQPQLWYGGAAMSMWVAFSVLECGVLPKGAAPEFSLSTETHRMRLKCRSVLRSP